MDHTHKQHEEVYTSILAKILYDVHALPSILHSRLPSLASMNAAKMPVEILLPHADLHIAMWKPGKRPQSSVVVKNRGTPKWLALASGNMDDSTCGSYPGATPRYKNFMGERKPCLLFFMSSQCVLLSLVTTTCSLRNLHLTVEQSI